MCEKQHVRNDKRTAIDALYRAQHGALLAYLIRLVGNHAAAEDLCHETFIKALRNWDQQGEVINTTAWLRRIATNTAYDYLRRRRRIRFTPLMEVDAPPSGAHSMESRLDEEEPVQQALAQIPAMYRLPLVLHSCEGRSTQEIAVAMGVSNSAIKTRLFRARERFREVYQA
jgi:RNA polymerase sigma-70 factor, ECF subfamily